MREPRVCFYNNYQGYMALGIIGDDVYQDLILKWFSPLADHYGLVVEKVRRLEGKKEQVVIFKNAGINHHTSLCRRLTRAVYEISEALLLPTARPGFIPDKDTRDFSIEQLGIDLKNVDKTAKNCISAMCKDVFGVPGYVIYPELYPLW